MEFINRSNSVRATSANITIYVSALLAFRNQVIIGLGISLPTRIYLKLVQHDLSFCQLLFICSTFLVSRTINKLVCNNLKWLILWDGWRICKKIVYKYNKAKMIYLKKIFLHYIFSYLFKKRYRYSMKRKAHRIEPF